MFLLGCPSGITRFSGRPVSPPGGGDVAGRAIIVRKGEKVLVVLEAEMVTALMEEIENTPV